MMRMVGFLLLLLAPLVGAMAQAPSASVFLDTDPMGAQVFLDGHLLTERTPVLLRGLAPGSHQVSLWHQGFQQLDQTFEVAAGKVPTVAAALIPTSVILAFPDNDTVKGPDWSFPAAGNQFRYPNGTYSLQGSDSALLTPVFPDETFLSLTGWGLLILSTATVLSATSDIYHAEMGWYDHPSELTIVLALSSLLDLPWFATLQNSKARFQTSMAPKISPTPEGLTQAQARFNEGEKALEAGDLVKAETLLSQVVREYPDSWLVPGAWFRLAKIHAVTGRKDLSFGEYRLVAETYPQAAYYDRARHALADLYQGAGNRAKARENLDAMVLVDGFFDPSDIATEKAKLDVAPEAAHAP